MVGRLASQGYVERHASQGDGRHAHIYLTERGHETIAAIDKVWKRLEKSALAGINDGDRRRLRKLLHLVSRNLNSGRGKEPNSRRPNADDG